jgi:hypothetical protein
VLGLPQEAMSDDSFFEVDDTGFGVGVRVGNE